jgi:hypothetical protein
MLKTDYSTMPYRYLTLSNIYFYGAKLFFANYSARSTISVAKMHGITKYKYLGIYTNYTFVLFFIRFRHKSTLRILAGYMTARIEDDGQLPDTDRQHKIPLIDIELKENQFMKDELEYYKEVKAKSKKNAHAEIKNIRIFR